MCLLQALFGARTSENRQVNHGTGQPGGNGLGKQAETGVQTLRAGSDHLASPLETGQVGSNLTPMPPTNEEVSDG